MFKMPKKLLILYPALIFKYILKVKILKRRR